MGWVYSPGCSTPYLSLWARMPSFKASDLDRLVFKDGSLVQLETLRGCTMLVPREHAEAALKVRIRTFTELTKQARQMMPITEPEMTRLRNAILEALETGPMTLPALQQSVPATLIRDFGPDCKRIGLTGSLSLAINLLKEESKVVKVQTQRRLDSTEYSFALVSSILPDADPRNLKAEAAYAVLAQQYFRAESPARVKDFAWWAGINVTDAIRAASELKPKLVPVPVEGTKDEFLIAETDLENFIGYSPEQNAVSFIPYRDTFLKGQKEVVSRFVPEAHADKPFSRWKGKLINDPLATIVHNGQVVGVWEWDARKKDVDSLLFDPAASKPLEKAIKKRSAELKDFIKGNLGEIRLQGLDYGPYQMTGIHQLKAFWGRGAQVDVVA